MNSWSTMINNLFLRIWRDFHAMLWSWPVCVCLSACTYACAAVAGMKLMSLSRLWSQLERFQQRSQQRSWRKDPWILSPWRAKVARVKIRRRPINAVNAADKKETDSNGSESSSSLARLQRWIQLETCAVHGMSWHVMTCHDSHTCVLKGLGVGVSSCCHRPKPS